MGKYRAGLIVVSDYDPNCHKTARSICDEVGDRLQQDLALEASPLPPYLESRELRKRECHLVDGVESWRAR
jgi:hypothetical protein